MWTTFFFFWGLISILNILTGLIALIVPEAA